MKFLGTPFYRTPPNDCFWYFILNNLNDRLEQSSKLWMNRSLIFRSSRLEVFCEKKRLWYRCFPVNFAEQNTSGDRFSISMQLQNFNCIKHRREMKKFLFLPFENDNWHLKAATGSYSVKRCSEVCFCLRIWGVLDST